MKKQISWKVVIMSLMLLVFYCFPIQCVQANESVANSNLVAEAMITSHDGGKLQPGDSFRLKVKVNVLSVTSNKVLCFNKATVTGAVTEESKPYLNTLGHDAVTAGEYELEISGLVFSGVGNKVSAVIEVQTTDGTETFTLNCKEYTLSAYTSSDFEDTLSVEKQENILVKTEGTQTVGVKITNKGKFTINQADVKLSLGSKVEGLKIKNDTYQMTNIKSKEVKTATFTVEVDKETKAGVYPATISVLGNSFSVNLQVDSNIVPSALEVCLADKSVFKPGVEKVVNLLIKNVGERDAKNIRVEMVNTENVSVVENSNVKRLNILKAQTNETISMNVRINSNYKNESVAIPIKINYLSSTGEAAEDTQYVYLYTNSTNAPSEVTISNVVSPSGTFDVDESFTVKFNISAKNAADNLQISVEGDEGVVPKSQNLFFVNRLESGESQQYSVVFAATRQAVTSSHPIKISVTYGKSDTPTTISQYGSVNIVNSKKDKEEAGEKIKGKPKVIIGEYVIEPTIVRAGENFVLTLGFLNTSSKHSVHNLKANILPVEQEKKDEDTGNVFTPVDGSNTIYIADLATGEMVTKVLNMYTIPSAAAKTYQITVDMAYEDEEGNEITAQESLGIPVEQMTKVEIGDINLSSGIVGESIPVSVAFYNRGRTKVNNMMVYIEGNDFTVEDNKTFIGTFDIGASETYEPTIIANNAGKFNGTLVVEYEDPAGQTIVEKKEFEVEAEEMMMDDLSMMDPSMMGGPEKPKSKLPQFIGIGVGVLVVMIIVIIVLKKRKAKKEEMMLNEEE